MQTLLNLLTNFLILPESTLGIGIAALCLLGAIILRHYHRPQSRMQATIPDWCVLAYVTLQLVTVTYSDKSTNTVHFIVPYMSALCFYCATRLLLPWPVASTKLLLRAAVLFGLVLAFANLTIQIESIHAAGKLFAPFELSSIRASLSLFGIPTKNDGLAVVLVTLPFALSGSIGTFRANRYFSVVSTVAAGSLVTVLILGFSRAAYIATAILLITFAVLSAHSKAVSFVRLAVVLASVAFLAGTTLVCLKAQRPALDTILVARTASERMSAQGHLTIWRESISSAAVHPLFGNGGGVDGIMALKRLGQSAQPFTARTYNAPLEVLIGSGSIGLALYGIFLFCPLWDVVQTLVHSERKSPLSPVFWILAAGTLTAIVRDMTYSSLVDHGATIVIVWVMVALVQNANLLTLTSRSRTGSRNTLATIACIALGLSCASIALSFYLDRAEVHYKNGCAEFVSGNYIQARVEFGQAIQLEPKQPMFYSADGLAAASEALGTRPVSNFCRRLSVPTKDEDSSLRSAEQDFSMAVHLSKDDSSFWSDLGWIQAFRGEESKAVESFERAVQADPNDAMSRISAGLLYERLGLKSRAYEQYVSAIAALPRIVDSRFFKDLHARDSDFAETVVERAVDLLKAPSTSPVGLASLAKLQAFLGEEGLARDEYVRALNTLPSLSYTWANLGALDLARGDVDTANHEFERALFLDGGNRLAANMLASVDLFNGKVQTAEMLYAKAILAPETSVHADRAWRLYHVRAPTSDDLLPQGLLSYISPEVQLAQLCDDKWLGELREAADVTPDAERRIAVQEDVCRTH